jgi:hypothetical protein
MSSKRTSRYLCFMMTLSMCAATTVFVSNSEGNPSAMKTEKLSAQCAVGGVSLRVLWTVSEYRIGGRAVWGKEEASALLFKPLDIDADSITFDGKTCRDVIFNREMVPAKEYLGRAFHTTPQAIGIPEEVVALVKTNCDLPGFSEYLHLRDRRIVICINGVFFFFAPAVNY